MGAITVSKTKRGRWSWMADCSSRGLDTSDSREYSINWFIYGNKSHTEKYIKYRLSVGFCSVTLRLKTQPTVFCICLSLLRYYYFTHILILRMAYSQVCSFISWNKTPCRTLCVFASQTFTIQNTIYETLWVRNSLHPVLLSPAWLKLCFQSLKCSVFCRALHAVDI